MKLRLFAHSLAIIALAATPFAVFADQPKAASAAISLPDLNPSEWFDGKMGGTFGAKTVTAFAKTNRVVVSGFRVVYVMHNEAHAFSRASYLPGGVETSGASSKMEVDLVGVDDATLQAITDQAYKMFLDQLKAAGREVVIPDAASFAEFKVAPVPQEVKTGYLRGKAFSPAGLPLWWQVGDSWGDAGLGQKNMRAFNKQSEALGAPISIAPMIVIDFAHMSSTGNHSSLLQRNAKVGTALAMSIPTFVTRVVRADQTRYGGIVFKGDDGALTLLKRIDTDLDFADLYKKGEYHGTWADTNRKATYSIAETSNDTYTAAARLVLTQATGAFAKLFAANPANPAAAAPTK